MTAPSEQREAERPVRIQLRRTKGWRKPAGAVIVSRPTKWGNPFDWQEAADEYGCTPWEARATVVMIYRDWLTMQEPERFAPELRPRRVAILAALATIKGKTLACWCPAGSPCHGDVLLEIANPTLTKQEGAGR